MVQLSVAIITFNEERNIGRCLDSVTTIADEIVVVDSYSTDRTEEICKAKGARFIQHQFEGYIEQKNYAASQTQFSNVLSLDADEALSEELISSITDVKKKWNSDGYTMNRLSNYCGQWIRHCGWYPDRKLRLFDKRKGRWSGTNPHDKFELDANASVVLLHGDILHYTYYTIEQHKLQAQKFSDIAANELSRKGKTSNWLLIITKTTAKFFRNYFLNLGFLDGYYGFVICRIAAYETFLKYYKLMKMEA